MENPENMTLIAVFCYHLIQIYLIRLMEVRAVCVLNLHIHLSISNFRNVLFKLISNWPTVVFSCIIYVKANRINVPWNRLYQPKLHPILHKLCFWRCYLTNEWEYFAHTQPEFWCRCALKTSQINVYWTLIENHDKNNIFRIFLSKNSCQWNLN